jgi:hypothetical protein
VPRLTQTLLKAIAWLLAAERNGWFGTPSRNRRDVVIRDASPPPEDERPSLLNQIPW